MYLDRIETYSYMKKIIDSIYKEIEAIKLLGYNSVNKTEDNKYIKLIKAIEKEVEINKISIEELKKPFLLFVVGSGNYGKSTVINVLLKDEIVETTDLPNTWKLDLFSLSLNEKMEIVYNDKSKGVYKIHKGNKILTQEEEKYKMSKKLISKELKKYRNHSDYDKAGLSKIKKTLEDKYLYSSNIVEVHYYLKDIDILNDFIIVDTPGLNQNLLRSTKETMKYYYNRADGILWMIDAQNIVAKENNALINEVNEIDRIYGINKSIIGVVNKMDIIEKYGFENVEKVINKVMEIYSDYFKDIVFISAKKGLDGLINKNDNNIHKSNIISLYDSIENNFKIFSEQSQIKSKNTNLIIMRDNINNLIENYKRSLYKDMSTYSQAEYELREKSTDLQNYVKENISALKNKGYLEKGYAIDFLKEDIEHIEDICKKSLIKIHKSLSITSNISKRRYSDDLNMNFNFTKSKYLISKLGNSNYLCENNESIKGSEISIKNLSYRNSKENIKYRYETKDNIIKRIENISIEVIQCLEEKINDLCYIINNLREDSFKDYHLSYAKTSHLIRHLNNIEDISNKMG